MEPKTKRLYEFGPFRLDPEESVLLRDTKPVYLKPKVFETLVVLIEKRGHVLDKETLMQELWGETFVEEANLTVNISQLRKALGQSGQGEEATQFIETLPRRGYRFVAEVREVWTEEAALVVNEYTSSRITIEEHETSGEPESPGKMSTEAIGELSSTPALALKEGEQAGALAKYWRAIVAAAVVVTATTIGLFLILKRSRPNVHKRCS